MSLIKKLAGETAIYGISSILSRLVNWVILTPYLTRVFEPDAYGVINDLYFWIALLLVLFTYRMETAFFRFGRQAKDINRSFTTATVSLLGTTILFTSVLLVFAQPIADLLKHPNHPEYVRWFVGIVAADALAAIPFARLRLENHPIRFAMIKAFAIGINIVFLFFFLEFCPWLMDKDATWIQAIYNENNRILYVFVANFLASVITLFMLLPIFFKIKVQHEPKVLDAKASDAEPVFYFDGALLRKMIVYAMPLVISAAAGIVNSLIGIPMLRFLASDAAAGIFSAASKLAVLMNLFTQAFNYAAEPFFFRHSEREDSKEIYAQVAQAFAIVGSVVFLGIMLYLDIIQYFLGKDFREGLGILPVLLIANLFLGLYYSISIWFKLSDKTTVGGVIAIGGSVITLLINYFFIPNPEVGYYAPAWAALACYGFMLTACYVLGQRYFPIDYPVGRMLTYIVLAVALYGLSEWLRMQWLENYILIFAINTALFIFYLFVLLRMERTFFGLIFKGKVK